MSVYSSQEAIDTDDGSAYYQTYENFFAYAANGVYILRLWFLARTYLCVPALYLATHTPGRRACLDHRLCRVLIRNLCPMLYPNNVNRAQVGF